MNKAKRIAISVLCGLLVMVITWKYQNYDYTLALEDAFFKKVFLVRDKILKPTPQENARIIFINTGKDLALAEDSVEYGNVAISDREKIYRLLQFINSTREQPAMTVVDIQFYYPFTPAPEVDSAMQAEISLNNKLAIPILQGKQPLYKARYGHSDYRTFGSNFNKFRILIQEEVKSIPLVMHELINGATYRDHALYPTCNGKLCLTALWPTYYLKDDEIRKTVSTENLQNIKNISEVHNAPPEYYNLGELLYELEGNPTSKVLADKVVIVGNFQEDVHVTPVGKMAGPVLLANIYLSLLNGQHYVSPWLILLLLCCFSALSYVALFKKMPEVNISFKFLFSSYLSKFIRSYISYFGAMFIVSLIALLFFNVQVALFLPSVIFSGIEYIKEKKYLELKK